MAKSEKVRVAFIIPNLGRGGAERVASVLLENLDRSKIQPFCIFYDSRHFYSIPHDVETCSLGITVGGSLQNKLINYIKGILKLINIVKTKKPDLVCSFLNRTNLFVVFARLLSSTFRNKVKLIISERTTPSVELEGSSFWLVRFLIKLLYRKADRIIAVSEGVRLDLIENFNLPEEKIKVIYNPLAYKKIEELSIEDLEGYEWFLENKPIVINVGSLSDPKSQDDLLRVFKIVRETTECRLVLLGEGEKEEELKKLSQELGINNDVAFLGFQDNPFKFISRSSVFVLSSRFEGFPNVLTEAMACGIPVISTRCRSGPEEIITDNVDGFLVPVGDDVKLADAILRVLGNRDIASSMAAAAKASVSRFNINNIVREYEELFISEMKHKQ
ncbi:MAG: glycosyltransferase [Nitrospirae bacterium]|nr:glycosyltransferase [Nitrospirota bacterium]